MTEVRGGGGSDWQTNLFSDQIWKLLHFTSRLTPSRSAAPNGSEPTEFTCCERNYVSLCSPQESLHFLTGSPQISAPRSLPARLLFFLTFCQLHTWWYKWWSLNPTRPGRTTETVLREEPRVCASKTKKKTRWVRPWSGPAAGWSHLLDPSLFLVLCFDFFFVCLFKNEPKVSTPIRHRQYIDTGVFPVIFCYI